MLLLFLSLSPLVMSVNIPAGFLSVCPSPVLAQASANKFLDFVLTNCYMHETTVFGPTECLVEFSNRFNPGPDPLPAAGACRAAYQTFIDTVVGTSDVFGPCRMTSEGIRFNAACAENLRDANLDFIYQTGSSIATTCNTGTVRAMAARNMYNQLVVLAATTNYAVFDFGDTEYGLCEMCYAGFLNMLNSQATFDGSTSLPTPPDDGWQATCTSEPSKFICRYSTVIARALADFERCSGGFDVFGHKAFGQPTCDPHQLSVVFSSDFPPYSSIAHCQYPQPSHVSACSQIEAYIDSIAAATSDSCAACFAVFRASLVSTEQAKSVCSDIWSDECLAVNGEAFFVFQNCAGVPMDTRRDVNVQL
jgi:hypothetical protein